MPHLYEHRNFMVFNPSELNSIDLSQVLETSIYTVRKSIDQSQTFVKWDSETVPPSVGGLTTKEGPYHYNEMLIILSTSGWTGTDMII